MKKGYKIVLIAAVVLIEIHLFNQIEAISAKAETKTNKSTDNNTSIIKTELDSVLAASGLFKTLPEPGPHDWLAHHNENGQPLKNFLLPHVMRWILSGNTYTFNRCGIFQDIKVRRFRCYGSILKPILLFR